MAGAVAVPQAQIVEPDDGFTLRLARKPETVIAEASLCASALIAAVRKNGWAQKFGNREHLFFEAWSFLATMYRVTPRVRETRLVQIGEVTGYEAFAEAFHVPSGIVIATADSMCLDDEDNWDMRAEYIWQGSGDDRKKVKIGDKPVPLFQLRSMAQTRAMSKALKAPFSWIVAMAGYAPTPANEMTGTDKPGSASQPQTKPTETTQDNGNVISEAQRKRLFAISKSHSVSNDAVAKILRLHGFESSDHITRDKYETICKAVEAAGEGQAT